MKIAILNGSPRAANSAAMAAAFKEGAAPFFVRRNQSEINNNSNCIITITLYQNRIC